MVLYAEIQWSDKIIWLYLLMFHSVIKLYSYIF